MDTSRFPQLMAQLYSLVGELEAMFPGRYFTPDGHMVGSIGEALAAYYYGLELLTASTQGCDAIRDGKRIEIKATQGDRVAFRCAPEHLLVLKIHEDGGFTEIYNGLGARVWALVQDKRMPSNGQHQVSLSTLRKLNGQVDPVERIGRAV
jgi:hypothetical protein